MDNIFGKFFGLGLEPWVSKFSGLDLGLGLGKVIRSRRLWFQLHHG